MNKAYGIWCLRNKCGATSSAAAAAIDLTVPAFEGLARLTWSLRGQEDGCRIYFSKTIWRMAYTFVLLALVSLPAFAQQRPLITEDVVTVKPGAVRFEA